MIKCKNCKRFLYANETKQSHIEVCGGIDDDSAESIGDIEDHFIICCFKCGQEVENEDYLHLNWAGNLICDDCWMEG